MGFYSDLAGHYDRIFPFREETLAFVRERLGGGEPPGGRLVLDVGCGPGRHAGRLAAAGFEAVGIDPDPAMITRARRDHPGARFHQLGMERVGDLRQELRRQLDGAFCIGNTFPHLPREGLPAFLAAMADLLRPGAPWIVQTVNWDRILATGGHEFPLRSLPGGLVFRREYRDLTASGVRFLTRLEGADGGVVAAGEVRLHPVRAATYESLHERAGLRPIARCGDWDGRPFDPGTSPATILVFARA